MITSITIVPDPNVEPGHQWLHIPVTPAGHALCRLLLGTDPGPFVFKTEAGELVFRMPHDANVDQHMLDVIHMLAHVRFSAPDLIQLTLTETPG